jgi:hypothetical protein
MSYRERSELADQCTLLDTQEQFGGRRLVPESRLALNERVDSRVRHQHRALVLNARGVRDKRVLTRTNLARQIGSPANACEVDDRDGPGTVCVADNDIDVFNGDACLSEEERVAGIHRELNANVRALASASASWTTREISSSL